MLRISSASASGPAPANRRREPSQKRLRDECRPLAHSLPAELFVSRNELILAEFFYKLKDTNNMKLRTAFAALGALLASENILAFTTQFPNTLEMREPKPAGAVAHNTLKNQQNGWVSVGDFGADPTASRNSVAGIRRAIDAVPNGGTVFFPCGTYDITSASGTEVFAIVDKVIHVKTAGSGSAGGTGTCATLVGAVGASIDVFHDIISSRGVSQRGPSFEGLTFSISGGNNLFHFDTQSAGQNYFADVDISRNIVINTPTGHAIFFDNPVSNGSGGVINSNVHENVLWSGTGKGALWATATGDSIRFYHNSVLGTGYALYAYQGNGAGNFTVNDNNVQSCQGITFDGGTKPIIANNEIELEPYCVATPEGYISMRGQYGPIDGGTIFNNMIQTLAPTTTNSTFDNIHVQNSTNFNIANNRLASGKSGTIGIVVDSTNTNLRIECDNSYSGFRANYSINPSAIKTQICAGDPWPSYTTIITCQNGSLASVGAKITATASAMITGRLVRFHVGITETINGTCNGIVFTLPLPARAKNVFFGGDQTSGKALQGQGAAGGTGVVVVDFNGAAQARAGYMISFTGEYEAQ